MLEIKHYHNLLLLGLGTVIINFSFAIVLQKSVNWRDFDTFSTRGWHPSRVMEYGPGMSFKKASDLDPKLQYLNNRNNGGSVWSSDSEGTKFCFALNMTEITGKGVVNADIVIWYYCQKQPYNIQFYPCKNTSGAKADICSYKGDYDIKTWNKARFTINVALAETNELEFWSGPATQNFNYHACVVNYVWLYYNWEDDSTLGKTEVDVPISRAHPNSKSFVWTSPQEFYHAGWKEYENSSKRAYCYDKPSDFSRNFEPLDSSVTGNGVWSGDFFTPALDFVLQPMKLQGLNIIAANLTVKHYCQNGTKSMSFFPCQNSNDGLCDFYNDKENGIAWITAEFAVNVSLALENGLRFFADPSVARYCFIDFVILTVDRDVGPCNESCRYQAVNCHTYFTCVDYNLKEFHSCPMEDGLAFNAEMGTCDRSENVEGCQCVCEYRPDPDNCSKFWYCEDRCKEETCELRTCPANLLWSVDVLSDGSEVQQCTLPEKAKCFNATVSGAGALGHK